MKWEIKWGKFTEEKIHCSQANSDNSLVAYVWKPLCTLKDQDKKKKLYLVYLQ